MFEENVSAIRCCGLVSIPAVNSISQPILTNLPTGGMTSRCGRASPGSIPGSANILFLSPFLKQSPTEHLQASVQFASDQKFLIIGPKKNESSIS